jgi:hypothetical protein
MLLGLVIGDGEKREIGFKWSGTDANKMKLGFPLPAPILCVSECDCHSR